MKKQIFKIILIQIVLAAILAGAAFAQNRGLLFRGSSGQNLRRVIESGAAETVNLSPESTGALDPTFGTGGRVVTVLPTDDEILDMAVQADGKMLVSAFDYSLADFYLMRYNTDGTLDNTFGTNGVSVFPVSDRFVNWGMTLLPDGKILMSGVNFLPGNAGDMAVFRFKANGSFDETWGTNGMVTVSFGNYDEANNILVQPNGKILLFGEGERGTMRIYDLAVARLNADGTLDTTFGTGGKAVYPRPELTNLKIPRSVALQSDGKIVILGADASNLDVLGKLFLLRINADGTTDNAFGANGFIFPPTPQTNGQIRKVRLQPDGKIIFAARSFDSSFQNSTSSVYRYNTNGTPDAGFGTNGIAANKSGRGISIVLQTDGKIIVGGSAVFPDGSAFALQRLNANGATDTTFGANGTITTGFDRSASIREMELQADGKLLAVGALFTGEEPFDVAAARYNLNVPSAPPLFDFDGDGRDDVSVFRQGNWYRLNSSDSAFSGAQFGIASDKIVPADYDGDRRSDLAVFRSGVWYILQSSTNSFRAVSFGQAGDVPVPGDYDGDGRADVAVFRGGNWYILNSQTNSFRGEQFGNPTDKPIIGDFDADGRQDLAVWRDGTWYINRSTAGFYGVQFGTASDKPVAADYDGDGKTDPAVFRPSTGTWYTSLNPAINYGAVQFGANGDAPVPADYDGDGRADRAVYRGGNWYVLNSANNSFRAVAFGAASDTPIQTTYLP